MAKNKMTDDEIDSFIKSMQVSSDQYVAPTVKVGTAPKRTTTQSSSNKAEAVQQTVTMPTLNKNNQKTDDKIALFNNANQNIQNKQVNELNEKNKNSGLFKGGSSNFLEGYANTMWDTGLNVGKGFFQTLEGLADFLQYKASDSQKMGSQALEKIFGKNPVSDFYSGTSNWLKENAKFDSTGSLFGTNENAQDTLFGNQWRNDINEKSYLGDMGDSIGEGIGNIGAMAALSAVGGEALGAAGIGTTATGTLTTGGKLLLSGGNSYMTAYGNSRSEAYKNGATDDEASKYAFINGLAEAASEQFFDAMPGIKSAGFADKLGVKDFLANKIKSGIGSNTAKLFLKLAGGLEEGGEEMISNALVAIGNDVMHMIDNSYNYGMENNSGNPLEDGWNALFSEDSLKSFMSAGFTSAILGFGGDVLTTTQQNQLINAYAKDNGLTYQEAKAQVEAMAKQQEQAVRNGVEQGNIEASNDVEISDIARGQAINNLGKQQNAQNFENTVQNVQNIEQTPQSNVETSNTLEEQLERQGSRILEQANKDVDSAKEMIQDYLEENNIQNPTKQDMMDAFGWYDEYDAAYDMDELQRAERIYSQAADELLQEREQAIREQETPILEQNAQENINPQLNEQQTPISLNEGNNGLLTNREQQSALNNENLVENEPNNNLAERMDDDVLKVDITGEKGQKYFEGQGVDEKVAKILSEKPKEQKASVKDTLTNTLGETYRLLVSRGGEVEKIAKVTKRPSVKYKYDKSMRARSEAQQHIGAGQADLNYKLYKNFTNKDGKQVNMSLNDIRQDAKANGISEQTLNEYLAHWLNVDRYVEGKPVFGESITDDVSRQEIAKMDEKHPEINRIAKNVWTYEHNELKNLYDSGLITENLYNRLAQYEHYVRIQRNIEKTNSDKPIFDRNGRLSVNQTLQKATGGNQDILPIMEGIANYTMQMTEAERMNEAARELANAISVGSQSDTISYGEESFGVNPEFVKANDNGTYTMTYFNKGVATEVPINKALYDAFVKNKAISAIENSKAFKAVTYAPKKLSTMFRGLTTNYNPMFMVTNAFKDIGDAPFNSKHATEFAKTYASTEALRQVAGNGVYNQLYNRAGGQDDSYFTEGEFKDKSQSKMGKVGEKLLTPITKGNEIVESVPRMAEFIATIKANGYEVNQDGELVVKNEQKAKGKTSEQVLDEALYNAAEVTTNFKRGGDLAKSINRNGGTFFNASIQGFDKQVRNFKDAFTSGNKKQIVALLTKALVLGIVPEMLNDGMYDDDDEYKELQDYIKDNYYVFKSNDGTWIRIPKGRAMSVIASAYRRTKDYASGDKDAFKGFVEFAAGQVAPNNPFESNIVSPFFAVKDNKSWSGNKIISQSLEKKPTNEQYNEKTDELSKFLGELLKDAPIPDNFKSPMGINYLIDQYTGGFGDVFLPMLTPKATGKTENPLVQPFVSKFTADADYSNKSVGTFYDTMTELEKKKNSANADKMDKLKYSYIYSQNMKMAELKKEQSKIQSDKSLSNEEKYNQAKEKQKEINELAKKSVKDLDNIKNNEYYAIVGDNIYYLQDNGDGTQSFKKDAYADSHKKTAEKKGMALYDYYKEKYEKQKEKEDK